MAESSIADDYFDHLVEYGLAICKECRYGILPSQVKSHLQRAHRISRKQADSAAEEVSNWVGLVEYASELLVPEQVAQPIKYSQPSVYHIMGG
ncbi:hypothetical protein M011DRAFT_472485 [Sporormia fimetaria CBS 119925]|uniref:C2H2-type domain-containing protein n=1 Tax=Sporormia fimetaria CBS 119925 TaxID=1340428 RepID=A0A6A6UYB0_9PLEO|nr:hypothetical protein M011DRAFT_472485 [Sporormia fimetaria CBS 119925]